jgi:hypothetical protein
MSAPGGPGPKRVLQLPPLHARSRRARVVAAGAVGRAGAVSGAAPLSENSHACGAAAAGRGRGGMGRGGGGGRRGGGGGTAF